MRQNLLVEIKVHFRFSNENGTKSAFLVFGGKMSPIFPHGALARGGQEGCLAAGKTPLQGAVKACASPATFMAQGMMPDWESFFQLKLIHPYRHSY